MAQLTCCSLQGFGLDTFCVQDYAAYVEDMSKKNIRIPRVRSKERFAGMVVFNDDTEETVSGFINMCKWSKPSVVCVDFSNLTSDGDGILAFIGDTIRGELGASYVDLESYEERFAFGLKVDCRDWSDHGDIVSVEDDSFTAMFCDE